MKDVWKRYRNGDHEYLIDYHCQSDGTIKMLCTKHPHNPFDTNVIKTHLYPDSNTICVQPGKEPRNFEYAEQIAYLFMQGYSEYVRTGKAVPSGGRVSVP